jgi:hypothetical protein
MRQGLFQHRVIAELEAETLPQSRQTRVPNETHELRVIAGSACSGPRLRRAPVAPARAIERLLGALFYPARYPKSRRHNPRLDELRAPE